MKTLLAVLSVVAVAFATLTIRDNDPQDKCVGQPCAKNFNYDENCARQIREQISRELKACMTYLAAGAHFAQSSVARPGIADMFFGHAREEREHAFKLADYLSLRGDHNTNFLISSYVPLKDEWGSAKEVLNDALKIEKEVTRHITNIITACESDFHSADWLTTDILDEQHKGTRELAGHLTQLKLMMERQPNLGEYLFDSHLK